MKADFCTVKLTAGGAPVSLKVETETRSDLATVCLLREADRVCVTMTPAVPVRVEALSLTLTEDFQSAGRVFLNGWQSWTDSRELPPDAKMRGLHAAPKALVKKYALDGSGDYRFTSYPNKKGRLHGWSYGYTRRGGRFSLFASLSEKNGFTRFVTDAAHNTLTAEKETCARQYPAGEMVTLMEVFLAEGTEDEVFDRWFSALGIPAPTVPPITGYTSWYRHYQEIDEEKLLSDLRGVKTCGFPFEIFQIDDGWEEKVGDWLRVDKTKFPRGMRAVRDEIAEAGLEPGLWLAPFVCERDSTVLREHPDWFLRDETGAYVTGGPNWSGVCALDFYNDEAREYVRETLRTATEDWGFKFLKLDFLYAACQFPRPDKTRGEIMCEAMEFIRACTPGVRLLGCGVPLMPAFGLVDYCRIGCDVGLDWDDKWWMRLLHRERVSTKNSLLNSVFRRELSSRAFLCDPDVFILRAEGNALTETQRETLAAINAICGGVLFTSDDPGVYNEKQKTLLREMQVLRGARLLDAREDGGELTLRFTADGRESSRSFQL